mmetsp:Transcript_25261/g.31062  ORF Transcript_25261/g.31062 Transcript_25261/m.31062 type:complete len:625 (-) Transcript_25261:590-2464(-)
MRRTYCESSRTSTKFSDEKDFDLTRQGTVGTVGISYSSSTLSSPPSSIGHSQYIRVTETSSQSEKLVEECRDRLLNTRQCVGVPALKRIPYVHGSYAASAPFTLRDPLWTSILKKLMPNAHKEGMSLLSKDSGPIALIQWAANNPVVSAYGVLQGYPEDLSDLFTRESITNLPVGESECSYSRASQSSVSNRRKGEIMPRNLIPNVTPLEWDVFLDPNIATKVCQAMSQVSRSTDDQSIAAAEVEVDRQIGRLISRMLLAHGSAPQLVTEELGFAPRYNFARVAQSTKTSEKHRGNGIFVEDWLSLFAASLKLGHEAMQSPMYESDISFDDEGIIGQFAVSHSPEEAILCGIPLCLGMSDPNSASADHSNSNISSNLQIIKDILCTPLKVVLDLKSRRIPPYVWARLVSNLRSRGLEVDGLGSFDIKELRSIEEFCYTPVTKVMFFHSAGDLQAACHANEIHHGDTIFLNGGSLLWEKRSFFEASDIGGCCAQVRDGVMLPKYALQPFAYPLKYFDIAPLDTCKSTTLEHYKNHYSLNIGLYVQEFSICEEALELLTKFVNSTAQNVYNLGVAFGGLNAVTTKGLEGDGYWNQRLLGKNWDETMCPTDVFQGCFVPLKPVFGFV